jgi:lipopolysaccharide transport system permease protein
LLMMIVFTVIFGRIAKLPTEGDAPYPMMVFAGMPAVDVFRNRQRWSSPSSIS